jgi:hypothetical protein
VNALIWTTFAVVVVAVPMLAYGAGALLAAVKPQRRERPVDVETAPAVEPVFTLVEPATTPQIAVQLRADGRWAVQKAGTQRASRVFDRKQDAVDRARAQATREKAELVIVDA